MTLKKTKQSDFLRSKNRKVIDCLYSCFKSTIKKLKIVCDWDEVIQAHEPYALYLTMEEKIKEKYEFPFFFKKF